MNGALVIYDNTALVADTVDGRNPANHLGCINRGNNGIEYLSTGAGFLLSTVVHVQISGKRVPFQLGPTC